MVKTGVGSSIRTDRNTQRRNMGGLDGRDGSSLRGALVSNGNRHLRWCDLKRIWRPCRLRYLAGACCWFVAAVLLHHSLRQAKESSSEHPSASLEAVVDNWLDDGGPGDPWLPPDERPIPLDAFPSLNGVRLKPNGHVNINATLSSKSNMEGHLTAGPESEGREAPTTLLFLHVWKCAGSSLRNLLRDWAKAKGQDIGIVVRCKNVVSKVGKVCLQHHALIDERVQAPYIRLKQILAGHFTWGFHEYVRQPYVMFTTLRNPLELFVSGQQYLNRKESRYFDHAVSLVKGTMLTVIKHHKDRDEVILRENMGDSKNVGFIYRLINPVGRNSSGELKVKTLDMAAEEAKENLDTFWLVGVIEQYQGFMAVLQAMMDPFKSERTIWKQYAVGKYNVSPQGAAEVLAAIDSDLVQEFNATLSHQWDVYSHAVELYKHRCRQMLFSRDLNMCEVPSAPSQYTLSEFEQDKPDQQMHPGEVNFFNASEMVRAEHIWTDSNSSFRYASEDKVVAFFEEHGFNLTDPEKRDQFLGTFRRETPELTQGADVFGSENRTNAEIAVVAAAEDEAEAMNRASVGDSVLDEDATEKDARAGGKEFHQEEETRRNLKMAAALMDSTSTRAEKAFSEVSKRARGRLECT